MHDIYLMAAIIFAIGITVIFTYMFNVNAYQNRAVIDERITIDTQSMVTQINMASLTTSANR